MQITNKTIIITGASEGIGREIALKLAKENCNLALIARNDGKLAEVQKLCIELGCPKVNVYPCDLTDLLNLKTIVAQIVTDFDSIDALINNAGIWQKKMQLDELEDQVINDVIATNLTSLIHLTKLVLPELRKVEEAAIINVSSRSGVTAQSGQSVYSATKWGVRGFTEVLKVDLENTNIKVAGVYQSGTKTNLFNKTGENFTPEKLETFTEPSDLAEVIVFMLKAPKKMWLYDVRVDH